MNDLVVEDERIEYHWTFTGTNTGPGGIGNAVRVTGYEEWTISDEGLIAASRVTTMRPSTPASSRTGSSS